MNNWNGIGRLVRDPEMRYTSDQKPIARYTLAVERRFKNQDGDADFIPCTAFGKSAEFAEKYLAKGKKIAVTGRIQTGSYMNKDGQKVYTTDIIVENQEFVESRSAEAGKPAETPTHVNPAPDDSGWMDVPENADEFLPFV